MKKTTLLIGLFALLINFNALSQNTQIEYGLKTGVNFSKYSGNLVVGKYEFKAGFYAGGFVNFGITEKLKIQPEVLFSTQGSSLYLGEIEVIEDVTEPPVFGNFKTKTTELTIAVPIVAQFYVSDGFYLEVGPQIGLILDRDEKVTESPTDDPAFNNIPDIDHDTFDLGLTTGLGYELNEKITLNSRAFFGLIDRDLFEVKSFILHFGIEFNL